MHVSIYTSVKHVCVLGIDVYANACARVLVYAGLSIPNFVRGLAKAHTFSQTHATNSDGIHSDKLRTIHWSSAKPEINSKSLINVQIQQGFSTEYSAWQGQNLGKDSFCWKIWSFGRVYATTIKYAEGICDMFAAVCSNIIQCFVILCKLLYDTPWSTKRLTLFLSCLAHKVVINHLLTAPGSWCLPCSLSLRANASLCIIQPCIVRDSRVKQPALFRMIPQQRTVNAEFEPGWTRHCMATKPQEKVQNNKVLTRALEGSAPNADILPPATSTQHKTRTRFHFPWNKNLEK